MQNRELIGLDLLKKITIYTLLMRQPIEETAFFSYLMGTHWYKETVDLYFNGKHEIKYDNILKDFLKRGIVKRQNGSFYTTIKP